MLKPCIDNETVPNQNELIEHIEQLIFYLDRSNIHHELFSQGDIVKLTREVIITYQCDRDVFDTALDYAIDGLSQHKESRRYQFVINLMTSISEGIEISIAENKHKE